MTYQLQVKEALWQADQKASAYLSPNFYLKAVWTVQQPFEGIIGTEIHARFMASLQ